MNTPSEVGGHYIKRVMPIALDPSRTSDTRFEPVNQASSSRARDIAERLVGVGSGRASKTGKPRAFVVVDRLGPHLATVMGNVGFTALITRALKLASVEVPWLREVRVKADGSLENLQELAARLAPLEADRGGAALLDRLVGLMTTLIGENLTLRLVDEAWPKPLPVKSNLGKGKKNAKSGSLR